MRRPDHSPDEPVLFDLPLGRPADRPEEGRGEGPERQQKPGPGRETKGEKGAARPLASGPRPAPQPEPAPTVRRDPRAQADAAQAAKSRAAADPDAASPIASAAPANDAADGAPLGRFAGAGRRLAAGGADLTVHGALVVGVFFGCRALGVQLELADWPPLLLFVLTFSFFYSVVPLAFWGHTLGMAWAGLVSHNRDGEPLTFDQTARRWVGGLLTLALAGLPLLTALRGRTFSDLLSGSETQAGRGPV